MSASQDGGKEVNLPDLIRGVVFASDQRWVLQSPWGLKPQNLVENMIRLNHWHFLKTGIPIFAFRALYVARPFASHFDQYLIWAHDYLVAAASNLLELVAEPPKEGKQWAAAAKAFGFSIRHNTNPFRKVRAIIEADSIYLAVAQLHAEGKCLTRAFPTVAKRFRISESKVIKTYYNRKKLVNTTPQ